MVHVPVLWLLLVAHVFLPEKVIAMVNVVGHSHVEGTLGVPALLQRHLDVDWADVRVGDHSGAIFGGFAQSLALLLLRRAPLDPLHIGRLIHRHFAVVGAAEDQVAHLPGKPFDDRMKSYFFHIVLAFGWMMFFARPHRTHKEG